MTKLVNKLKVEFFFDVISPYSYIAFESMTALNKRHNCMDFQLKPLLVAGLMNLTGNRPPGVVPAKAKFMLFHTKRLSKLYGIPFHYPEHIANVMFEKGSLSPQRLLTAVRQHFPDYLEPLTRELFLRVWLRDIDIILPESLQKACENVGMSNKDVIHLLDLIKTSEVKDALKKSTQCAIDYGAFGVPSYVAHFEEGEELFFGCDQIPLFAQRLHLPWP